MPSTLLSAQTNIRTSQLLERSQQQSEEMAAQEEEMRQNMEELQATQEESTRKGEEFKGTLDAMDKFLVKIELSTDFTIQNANALFLNKFNFSMNEIVGRKAEEIITNKRLKEFQKNFNKILSGNSFQEIIPFTTKNGDELNLITSLSPIYIEEKVDKILFFAIDINDFK